MSVGDAGLEDIGTAFGAIDSGFDVAKGPETASGFPRPAGAGGAAGAALAGGVAPAGAAPLTAGGDDAGALSQVAGRGCCARPTLETSSAAKPQAKDNVSFISAGLSE